MSDFIKIIFSKEFISSSKEIISILKKSKSWKKDITRFNGTFLYADKDDSTVLINQTIKVIREKQWNDDEIKEVHFILNELFENSFKYGLPSKEHSFIDVEIYITSTFVKMRIKDFGQGFNLEEELKNQEAYNYDSTKHKGLSLVNLITPEIYQEESHVGNIIVLIKRQGLKPLKIEKYEDITIFKIGNGNYINDTNYRNFLGRLNKLEPNSKIIIDYSGYSRTTNVMTSIVARRFRDTLDEKEKEFHYSIAITGLTSEPWVVQDFYRNRFPTFNSLEEAIDYFKK